MTKRDSFNFTPLKELQAQILGIPYKNSDLSMFVLLPNDINGLEKVKPCISPFLLSLLEALHLRAYLFWVSPEVGLLNGSLCLAVPSGNYFCLCASMSNVEP